MWQDYTFSVANILFMVALVPSLLSKDKPAFATSLLNTGVLLLISFTYASLGLVISTILGLATAGLWIILAWQKFSIAKRSKR